MDHTDTQLPIAAIVHDSAEAADEQLYPVIQYLQEQGLIVLGVVQAPEEVSFAYRSKMGIMDLKNGAYTSISQDLGEHNTSCCLDSAAVSAASIILKQARNESPDLLVVNRFGKLEAEGEGFADEMLEIMSEGLPMITVVATRFLPEWREFSGGLAKELPADSDQIKAWCLSTQPSSRWFFHSYSPSNNKKE